MRERHYYATLVWQRYVLDGLVLDFWIDNVSIF